MKLLELHKLHKPKSRVMIWCFQTSRVSPWKLGRAGILKCFILSPLCSPSHPSGQSLISYLCLLAGRWHPEPATRCTLVTSLLEPSSTRSRRGSSCQRQHHLLMPLSPEGQESFSPATGRESSSVLAEGSRAAGAASPASLGSHRSPVGSVRVAAEPQLSLSTSCSCPLCPLPPVTAQGHGLQLSAAAAKFPYQTRALLSGVSIVPSSL